MDNHDQIAELEQDIDKLKRIIARLTSDDYLKDYKQQQWKAWALYLFTRKLPKNREWKFTTKMVSIPIISLSGRKPKNLLTAWFDHCLLIAQKQICQWWAEKLPYKVTLNDQRFTVPVPYLIREDTEEHLIMLCMFLDEKVQQRNNLKNGNSQPSELTML